MFHGIHEKRILLKEIPKFDADEITLKLNMTVQKKQIKSQIFLSRNPHIALHEDNAVWG